MTNSTIMGKSTLMMKYLIVIGMIIIIIYFNTNTNTIVYYMRMTNGNLLTLTMNLFCFLMIKMLLLIMLINILNHPIVKIIILKIQKLLIVVVLMTKVGESRLVLDSHHTFKNIICNL